MKVKRLVSLLLFGLVSMVVILVGGTLLTMPGGPLAKFIAPVTGRGAVRIYVQAPPLADVGEEFTMVVTVHNQGEGYLQVDEIRLPKELIEVAVVTGIFPGSLDQEHYKSETGFQIDFMLAPGDRQEFKVTLLPRETADVMADVGVVVGENKFETGVRLVFDEAVAIIPTATPTLTPTPTATPEPPTPTPTPEPIMPYEAVVKITAKIKRTSIYQTVWSGSGTILTPDGLILTNAHILSPNKYIEVDALVVSLTTSPDEPPVEMYYAEPVQSDPDLDIAVIQISTDMNFITVDRASLNLPTITLGDSDELKLGDPITILGYPIIGGETITLTRGDVSGFTSSRKYGPRAYIKTSASIAGGTSGGLVMDSNGYQVGIPTKSGPGGGDDFVDCRVVADTNGDGDVNDRDVCVPVGGFINALRPINLALPLIEEAKRTVGSDADTGLESSDPGQGDG